MPARFVLVGLRPEISPVLYEQFIREYDYPMLPVLRTIVNYCTHRVGPAPRDPALLPFDYIEQIVVSDLEAYWRDLDASPGFHRFRQENPKYVERKPDFWSEVVAPSPLRVSRGPRAQRVHDSEGYTERHIQTGLTAASPAGQSADGGSCASPADDAVNVKPASGRRRPVLSCRERILGLRCRTHTVCWRC